MAAPSGAKRCRLKLEGEEIKKEMFEVVRDIYSDIDLFLEDSSSEEEEKEEHGEPVRQLAKEVRVMAVKVSVPIKVCQVNVERLFVGNKHIIDIENVDINYVDKEGGSSSESDVESR